MKSFNIGDLKISVPIIQGGMGIGVSLSRLASAVANMGGIGTISSVGIGFIDRNPKLSLRNNHIEALRDEIRKARELSSGVLGVNIMTVLTNFSDLVKTSIDEGIDVIFSGAGLPLDLPKYLSPGSGTKLVPIVSSARAASIITQKWKQNYDYLPDAFVIEGPEAGGHLGFKPNEIDQLKNSLDNIVSQVSEVVQDIKEKYNKAIPLIAAGGIHTGKDILDIMKKGASAVQLGTRFVATEECDASPEFKNALISAGEEDVEIIKSPVGLPGRTISNKFLKEADEGRRRPSFCKYNCIRTCDPKTTSFCIAEALLQAYKGNLTDGFAFSGSNAGLVNKMSTVKSVFNELIRDFNKAEGEE